MKQLHCSQTKTATRNRGCLPTAPILQGLVQLIKTEVVKRITVATPPEVCQCRRNRHQSCTAVIPKSNGAVVSLLWSRSLCCSRNCVVLVAPYRTGRQAWIGPLKSKTCYRRFPWTLMSTWAGVVALKRHERARFRQPISQFWLPVSQLMISNGLIVSSWTSSQVAPRSLQHTPNPSILCQRKDLKRVTIRQLLQCLTHVEQIKNKSCYKKGTISIRKEMTGHRLWLRGELTQIEAPRTMGSTPQLFLIRRMHGSSHRRSDAPVVLRLQ